MMTLGELESRMNRLDGWSIEDNWIVKDFDFENFKESLDFVNKVGEIAERVQHHPDIVLSPGHVRISLTTHEDHGLSKKDFDTAEEIDKIGKEQSPV